MKNLISIIIPVYNRGSLLSLGIESLLSQTYKDIEIILVDDGSKDNSLEVCNYFASKDNRIKVISQANGGVSSARNAGLRAATGSFIGFMDAGDFLMPSMYESLITIMLNNDADAAVCAILRGKNIISSGVGKVRANDFLKNNINTLSACNKLFKRELINYIKFNTGLSYAEDFLFTYTALSKAKYIVCTDMPLYVYCIAPESATQQPFSFEQFASFKAFQAIEKQQFTIDNLKVRKAIQMHKIYNMVGCMRKITITDANHHIENYFIRSIRANIFNYIFTNYPVSNRIFALALVINANFAKKIYKLIFRVK